VRRRKADSPHCTEASRGPHFLSRPHRLTLPFLPSAAALGKEEEEGRRMLLWLKFEFPSLLIAKYIDHSPSHFIGLIHLIL